MHLIEPYFAFYDPDFALYPMLQRQAWPVRKDAPDRKVVRKLSIAEPGRSAYMWSKLETDPAYRTLAQSIWVARFGAPPATPAERADRQRTLAEQIARAATAVATLRARGVPVLFVREPSIATYLAYENRAFPRRQTWDVLLAKSGAPGIYFGDYPELSSGLELPEWSHLNRSSAERYTAALYHIMERDFAPADGSRW